MLAKVNDKEPGWIPEDEPRTIEKIKLVIPQASCAILLTLLNKWILNQFPYPLALTLLHQLSCWSWSLISIRLGKSKIKLNVSHDDLHQVGTLIGLRRALMNTALQWSSLVSYSWIHLMVLPLVVGLQYKTTGTLPPLIIRAAIALMIIGGLIGNSSYKYANPIQGMIALSAMLTDALSVVSFQQLAPIRYLDPAKLDSILAASSKTLLLLFIMIEGPSILACTDIIEISKQIGMGLFASSVVAIAYHTSSTTIIPGPIPSSLYSIWQFVAFFIITMAYGLLVTNEQYSIANFVGLSLAILGLLVYVRYNFSGALGTRNAR
jgi:hypothetical protein